MSRQRKADNGYLIAEPAGFPGARIPLLSDEECRARGIEPGRLPPRETWTQQQRDAADRLEEILLPYAILEAWHLIADNIEDAPADSPIPESELERTAARKAISVLDSGQWKRKDTTFYIPQSWVRQILEVHERGDLSVLN
jgi:hypothetical protein